MSRELYHEEIRRLAEQAHGAGFLEAPSGRASLDSPMCGDRISVEVHVKGGVVLDYAHRVQGCLLCRAAASAIADRVKGAGLDELQRIRQVARTMLANEGAPPPPPPGGNVSPASRPPGRIAAGTSASCCPSTPCSPRSARRLASRVC